MDSVAARRVLAVRPMLQRVVTAGEALGLPPRTLLHAGPALRDPCQPPLVLMSSAVMSCLHEGWATDPAAAAALVRTGAIRWLPAQESGCLAPLAHTISRGTPLFEVVDAAGARAHAPVSTVGGPDTRMGHLDPALLQRLADRDRRVAPAWQRALAARGPLPLLPLAAEGLAHGDDLHSRTSAANSALVRWLRDAGDEGSASAAIEATPLFFLTLWMAACALMLRAAEGQDRPSLLTRAGGNGERFAVALAGAPSCWVSVAATPPLGPRGPGLADAPVCGAIGDSAVIDIFGCGGQALAGAEEPSQVFADFLPGAWFDAASKLLRGPVHPQLARPVLLDARHIVDAQCAPLIMLAKIAEDGLGGFVGRGLYRPPLELFELALRSLADA